MNKLVLIYHPRIIFVFSWVPSTRRFFIDRMCAWGMGLGVPVVGWAMTNMFSKIYFVVRIVLSFVLRQTLAMIST